MSRKQYPVIGRVRKVTKWVAMGPGKGPVCNVCGSKATHLVDVEVSYMRGDDVVLKACGNHLSDPHVLLNTPEAAKQLAS